MLESGKLYSSFTNVMQIKAQTFQYSTHHIISPTLPVKYEEFMGMNTQCVIREERNTCSKALCWFHNIGNYAQPVQINFIVILYQSKESKTYNLSILAFPKNVELKTKASGVSCKHICFVSACVWKWEEESS